MKLTKLIPIQQMTWVRRAMLWSAFIGLFASIYLLITYITGGPIACGIVSGCETVRASKWAYTMGIPRPLLGVAFYFGVIFLMVVRLAYPAFRPMLARVLFLLAAFIGFIESAFLTMVQWYDIKAFCIWCLTSAVAATVLFVLSFFESNQDDEKPYILRELKVIFFSFAAAILIGGICMNALLSVRTEDSQNQDTNVPQGTQALIFPEGTPYEGPATATVTLVEFVDIPCPVCRSFSPIMQAVREDYAGRIRFAIRTFMLPEIHAHAKESAIATHCAGKQGKFIEYADAAILNQDRLERADLVAYADALHLDTAAFTTCLDDASIASFVEAERKAGERLGVDSTPSIFINTKLLKGISSYPQLKQALDEALASAETK